MTTLRSLLFVAWLYLSMAVFAVGMSPALLLPHRYAMWVIRSWSRFVLFGLRWIAGVRVEVRGLEHRPTGAALVASKHQGMLDIVALLAVLPDACFVMKKELMPLPFSFASADAASYAARLRCRRPGPCAIAGSLASSHSSARSSAVPR